MRCIRFRSVAQRTTKIENPRFRREIGGRAGESRGEPRERPRDLTTGRAGRGLQLSPLGHEKMRKGAGSRVYEGDGGNLRGREERRNGGSSQRCGQPSVPKWFFWFLVGSTADGRPNQREPDPGFPSFAAFCPSRVSWPVVGVRMRLAWPGPAGDGRGEGWPSGGITRLLRSADSPEEIIVATHETGHVRLCPFDGRSPFLRAANER